MRCKPVAYTFLSVLTAFSLTACGDKSSTAANPAGGESPQQATPAPASQFKELKIEDTKPGTGKAVAKGDMVWVLYTGKLTSGKVFDSTDKHEGKPYAVSVGAGEVIKGWDEGLVGLKVGGERRLSIPWKDAYGERGNETIPPKSDLIFDVKAVALVKKGEEDIIDVTVEKQGKGPEAKVGDTVTIDYVGTLPTGEEFDSTKTLGKPVSFRLGKGESMDGLDNGIRGMKVGEKRRIVIPPRLGKPEGTDKIPSNSVLIFEVELKSIKPGEG